MLKKDYILLGTLTALLLLGSYFSLCFGAYAIEFGKTLGVFLAKLTGFPGPDMPVETTIIWEGRMPRLIVGFLVGFSLAAAGCIMQGLFRNPMASPGMIGASSGAALGAVTCIYLGLAAKSMAALPVFAVLAALLSLMIVFAIATSGGRTSMATLLLAGIAVSLVFSALTSFIITLGTSEFDVGRVIITWLMGDLNNRSWHHVRIVFSTTCLSMAGIVLFLRDLNVLMIDDETAANLGISVNRVRNTLLVLSALLTGGAIAVSGVIGFVGLIAPHMTRGRIGPDNRKLLPLAGLLGAVFVIYADLFVKLVVNIDLRIGILTSLLGGPFFLFLLIRHRKEFEYL